MAFTQSPLELSNAPISRAADFRPEHGKKLAQRLAEQIEKDIVGAGWPVGSALGREADLLERYPVSRAVLREAIAIVEQDGIAQMRRGIHGGLFVIAPADSTVVLAMRNFLEASGVDLEELLAAREAVEGLMLQLAARKLNPASMENLRLLDTQAMQDSTSLAAARELLRGLQNAADNPLLSAFVDVLGQVGVSMTFYRNISDKHINAYLREALALRHNQIEALIANDLGSLRETMRAEESLMRVLHSHAKAPGNRAPSLARVQGEKRMRRLLEMSDVDRKVKLADVVALQLQAEIIRRGWPIGERLGLEPELVDALGVSRGAFREAVRALERLGVVRTVSGRHGGGLYIAAPDPAQTIRRTLLYFGRRPLSMETISEVNEAICLAAISALAKRVATEGPACLDLLRRATENADGLTIERYARNSYLSIAESCGNRVIALFMQIISGLTALRAPSHSPSNPQKLRKLSTAQEKIIDTITRGDVNAARRWIIELSHLVTQEDPVSRSALELI